MAFSIYFSVTMMLFLFFVVSKKNLNVMEIVFMWMIINLIHHNFLTVAAVNLKLFDFSDQLSNYWTLVFMRVFLFPLLIIWYMDRTLAPTPYKKWGWLPIGILLLVGVEYSADMLNVYKHSKWKLWWSFIEWFVIFLLVNYSWIWFRNLLRKEMS